MNSKLSHLL